jgi:hypothetical protein
MQKREANGGVNPCTFYNGLPVSYIPDATANVGVYYGISRNERVLIEPRFWIGYTGSQHIFSNYSLPAPRPCRHTRPRISPSPRQSNS